jgi:dihydrofolate reductase
VRELMAIEYESLDGVIQGPGFDREDLDGGFTRGGWTRPYMSDHRRYGDELYPTAGAFLLGRRTYEIFAAYWPTVTDDGDLIARALNTQPKYVVSRTLSDAGWNGTTVLRGDVAAEVATLKEGSGKPILLVGSSELAQSLMRNDLIDVYQLWVHPVVLGQGKRLFRDGGPPKTLKLTDSRTTALGLVIKTYRTMRA